MSKGLIGELENKKNIVLKAGDLNLSIDNAYKQGVVCGLDFAIKLTKSTIDDILGELEEKTDGNLDDQYKCGFLDGIKYAKQIITRKIGGTV